LDIRTFVVEKLHDDGTWVPKHVCVGIWNKFCFLYGIVYFNYCVFWFWKIRQYKKCGVWTTQKEVWFSLKRFEACCSLLIYLYGVLYFTK
jgi:hypothetical protein